jgi:adenylate cyclase
MSDIFISYARSTEAQARQLAEALRALGYGVWRDDELPAHRPYGEVIEERLRKAKAVVVIWSAEAVKSQWVRAEANVAREAGTLVQLRIDNAVPPLPFNEIQCADMPGWNGRTDSPGWLKVVASLADLTGGPASPPAAAANKAKARGLSICVLPFANMSDDPQQEYFSDGISEDIITDLSKVSALFVVARNTAFTFKGKSVEAMQIARQLQVSHILEGSVRKAGGRVRITAQLIDGATGGQVWAERYDRDLTDIFALQDEISEAIVGALKLKLLPEERKAIERRGTDSVEAYSLYLMARQLYLKGRMETRHGQEVMMRLCVGATKIDGNYAPAWALLALIQTIYYGPNAAAADSGLAAADRALSLDGSLAEAHVAKARALMNGKDYEGARQEFDLAFRLNPKSPEANFNAGILALVQRNYREAIPLLEKAADLFETNHEPVILLIGIFIALGDVDGARGNAELLRRHCQSRLDQAPDSGMAMGLMAWALAVLGECERARELIDRGLLIDPDNVEMKINFSRALAACHDLEKACDILEPIMGHADRLFLDNMSFAPDVEPFRGHPRFQAMIAAAEARLAGAAQSAP